MKTSKSNNLINLIAELSIEREGCFNSINKFKEYAKTGKSEMIQVEKEDLMDSLRGALAFLRFAFLLSEGWATEANKQSMENMAKTLKEMRWENGTTKNY